MDRYGVMNEEKHVNPDNSSISDVDIIADHFKASETLTLNIKVTDSDIRSIEVCPSKDRVGILKSKVTDIQGFIKELESNQKIRLIYNGRIMLDSQSLSIYSKFQ